MASAPSLAEAASAFADHLSGERRMSPRTVEAYGRDLAQLDDFLTGAAMADLARLTASDWRAFLAHRRREGAGARTLQRQLSSLRTFLGYAGRRYGIRNETLALIDAPKAPRRAPRPVSAPAAQNLIADALSRPGQPAWIRARDAAVLSLLYGGGLRISEALALRCADHPLPEMLRVAGKGGKTRLVPVLPAVRDAITEHCDASPDTDINWQEAAGYTVNRSDDRGVIVTLPGPGDVITRAGTGDHVSVWQHPEDASCYYILTRRDNLDYYGITVWAPENGPEEGSGLTLFSQDPGAPHGWSMLSDRELLDMHHGAGDLA